MAIEYAQISGDTLCSEFNSYIFPVTIDEKYPNSDMRATFNSYFVNMGFDFWINGSNIYDFTTFYIEIEINTSNNYFKLTAYRKSDDFILCSFDNSNGPNRQNLSYYVSFAIDRNSQLGYLYIGSCQTINYESNKWQYYIGGGMATPQGGTGTLYDVITQAMISYNWQSVPSISGKNGILSLSTLNDVNDGEPVETSDVSKFNLTDDSNVSALVAAHFSQ